MWRNQCGLADYGNHKVPYGLCKGSSDLILIVKCWAEMDAGPTVGYLEIGRFAAFEVKTAKGRATKEQLRFIELVRTMGGFADIIRSVEQAQAAIEIIRAGGYQLT